MNTKIRLLFIFFFYLTVFDSFSYQRIELKFNINDYEIKQTDSGYYINCINRTGVDNIYEHPGELRIPSHYISVVVLEEGPYSIQIAGASSKNLYTGISILSIPREKSK